MDDGNSTYFRGLIQRLFHGAWMIDENPRTQTITFRVGGINLTEKGTLIPLRIATGSNDISVIPRDENDLYVTIHKVTKFPTPP